MAQRSDGAEVERKGDQARNNITKTRKNEIMKERRSTGCGQFAELPFVSHFRTFEIS